jgi:hypothetical protein
VIGGERLRAGEVGDRARDLEDAVVPHTIIGAIATISGSAGGGSSAGFACRQQLRGSSWAGNFPG